MEQKYLNLCQSSHFQRHVLSKEIVQLFKIHWTTDRKASNILTLKAGNQGTFLGQYSPENLLQCQEPFMQLMQKLLKQRALPGLFYPATFTEIT